MTLSRLPLWFWVGSFLTVAATAVGVTVLVHFDTGDPVTERIQTLITVVATGAPAAAWLWRRAQASVPPPLPLERAADALAEQVRQQWERASAERGLVHPTPISLRWRWSPRQVTGPIAEALQGPFVPVPTMTAVTTEDLQGGTLADLFRVYGGLGSGRLILLGEPGAGKSGAGILLLRAALTHRATVPAEDRARVPVPVLLTPQGWNPTEPFADWLAAALARDYALLQAPEYGENAAMRLLKDGHLAVILDGFDEIPEAQRPLALRALTDQVSFRLVVLTRTQEWESAVRRGHLPGAAALELQPVDPQQAAEYLASSLTDPLPNPWQHVVHQLREEPEGALAQALTTPLTLTLLRDTYGPGEPVDELINARLFFTRKAVEDHLLDRVLTAAYTRRLGQPDPLYTVNQARRWLGQLAHWMNEEKTHDLAWWRIPRWVPAWPRAVATVVVIGLVAALLVWSLAGSIAHMDLLAVFSVRPLVALAAAFTWALGYAFMVGPGLLFMTPPGGRFFLQSEQLRWSKTDILIILLLGAGVGIASGVQTGLLKGLEYGLTVGLASGVVVGLGFVLGGGPPQRLGWLRWSRTETRTNLRTGLVLGIGLGLVVGFGYGFGYGLKYGLEYGFMVGTVYLLVIVIGGRTSRLHSQLRWNRTTTLTTLLMGLVIAIVSTGGYGIIYVLIVMIGGRPSLQRSQLRWNRTITPTTLLIGLVAGPVLWLWYRFTIGSGDGFLLALGLGFGLTAGLVLGLRPSVEATSPLDPQSLWRRERQGGLVVGLVMGLVVGLLYGLRNAFFYGHSSAFADALVYGLTGGLLAGLGSGLVTSATWATALASVQLRRRNKTPARLLRFLADAHQRQILRTVGPVYQFRDTRLQDRLAGVYQNMPRETPHPHTIRG